MFRRPRRPSCPLASPPPSPWYRAQALRGRGWPQASGVPLIPEASTAVESLQGQSKHWNASGRCLGQEHREANTVFLLGLPGLGPPSTPAPSRPRTKTLRGLHGLSAPRPRPSLLSWYLNPSLHGFLMRATSSLRRERKQPGRPPPRAGPRVSLFLYVSGWL